MAVCQAKGRRPRDFGQVPGTWPKSLGRRPGVELRVEGLGPMPVMQGETTSNAHPMDVPACSYGFVVLLAAAAQACTRALAE